MINKYSSINNFIIFNYDLQGNLPWDFFYKYISEHRDKIEHILSLLEKLKELGFSKLELNENFDFKNTQYKIYTSFKSNIEIEYLDNIDVIPNYRNDIVEYETVGSNYKMILRKSGEEISEYDRKIVVNSLLFDSKTLPETISKESIFDKIISLKDVKKQHCNAIKNSVDLSISVCDLYSQFNSTNIIIENLDDIKNKEQLHNELFKIKESLDKLQTMSSEYDESICQTDSFITKEKLEDEKKLYLERRWMSSIHVD